MVYIRETAAKLFHNQRVRVFLMVAGAALAVAGIFALIILILSPNKDSLPSEITYGTYSEEAIKGLEMTSTFSKSILSTEKNSKLESKPYIIDNSTEYQKFLEKYDNITVLEPEQVPLVDDWFKAGYYALVCSTDEFGVPVNLYATMWASDSEGTMTVIMGWEPINEDFTYSENPNDCVQASAVVFLPQDAVLQAERIEILF